MAMTTNAAQVIEQALSLLGVIALGESADPEVIGDGLLFLNDMVDSWSTDSLFIYAQQELSKSCAPGTSQITLGPTGDIVTDRPYRIEPGAFFRVSNLDYRMEQIDRIDYDIIVNKSVQATYPNVFYYEPTEPNGVMKIWPCLASTATLYLPVNILLSQFVDAVTSYLLPPGYKRALVYSLAEEMAPTYRPCSPDIIKVAQAARRNIRRLNTRIPTLAVPSELNRPGRFNVLSNTRS